MSVVRPHQSLDGPALWCCLLMVVPPHGVWWQTSERAQKTAGYGHTQLQPGPQTDGRAR